MKGRGQRKAHQRVAQEFENIKLGWLHAAAQGQVDLLIRAFGAFWLDCIERNVFFELYNVCVQSRLSLEKHLPPIDRQKSPVELTLGVLLIGEAGSGGRFGDFTIVGKIDQAIAYFRSFEAYRWIALALNFKGAINQSLGNYETARQCFAESADLGQKAGDRWLIGYSLNDLGLVLHLTGDTVAAQELSRQSLDILTELDDRRGKAFAFNNLGLYAFQQGDYAEADWLYRECIKLRQVNGDQWGVATGIIHLAA
ncbi:MAG: tetratricopeptide repeat protein, partial [Burkholderiaceae bacterium]|nr:tetratricopeptide repeat protein [Burkholderiaceae bacterium]